jgi:probable rRNA maturation factor
MNTVDITVEGIEEPPWIEEVGTFCKNVLQELQLDNWEVSIVFCNNDFIRELNNRFRGKNEATDVLSFSQLEGDDFPSFQTPSKMAGDIVISLDMVEQNQRETGDSWETELKRLLIHGILHLAGYDHADKESEEEMMEYQNRLLQHLYEGKIL